MPSGFMSPNEIQLRGLLASLRASYARGDFRTLVWLSVQLPVVLERIYDDNAESSPSGDPAEAPVVDPTVR